MMKRSFGNFSHALLSRQQSGSRGPQERSGEASTTLLIQVQFRPRREGELPPSLQAAQFQLRAVTFLGLEPWQDYPSIGCFHMEPT